MFQISCQITKAKDVGGLFKIKGVASDTSIDRDEEKFSPEALVKMKERIKKQGVPLRVEHQNGWHNIVGQVTDAGLNDKGQLVVEATIDKDMSVGRDFIHICKLAAKGMATMPGFSVAGAVLDAGYEFVKELGKNIKVYKDIIIEEISLVTHPSNKNVTLQVPFAKSVNWESVEKGSLESSIEGAQVNTIIEKIRKDSDNNTTLSIPFDISDKESEQLKDELMEKSVATDDSMSFSAFLIEKEYTFTKCSDAYANWFALQEFLEDGDRPLEMKKQAIQLFTETLENVAKETYEIDSEQLETLQKHLFNTLAEEQVSKFTLTPYLSFFMKTMLHSDTLTLVLNPNEIPEGISFYESAKVPEYMKSYIKDGVVAVQVEKAGAVENITPLTMEAWEEIQKACGGKKAKMKKSEDPMEEEQAKAALDAEVVAPEAETATEIVDKPQQNTEEASTETTTASEEKSEDVASEENAEHTDIVSESDQTEKSSSCSSASRLQSFMEGFIKQCSNHDNIGAALDSLVSDTKGLLGTVDAAVALDSGKLCKHSCELNKLSTSLSVALPLLAASRLYSEEVTKGDATSNETFSSLFKTVAKDCCTAEEFALLDKMSFDSSFGNMIAGLVYYFNSLVCYKLDQYMAEFASNYAMEDQAMPDTVSMGTMKTVFEANLGDFYQDEFVKSLPDEAFALILGDGDNRVRMLPHHNKDLSVNKNAVLDSMRRLLTENISPELGNFKKAFDSLLEHLKEFSMAWTAKNSEEEKVEEIAEKTVTSFDVLEKVLKSEEDDVTEEQAAAHLAESAAEQNATAESPAMAEDGSVSDIEEVAKAVSSNKVSKALGMVVDFMATAEERFQKSDALSLKVDSLSETVQKSVQLLEQIASQPVGRKSVAVYAAVQKSQANNAQLTEEQLLDHNLEAAKGDFQAAYKATKQGAKI